jgi:excisionase family DNA binding protein
MAEEWLTTAEAAELSGYHSEHLRELVREGKIDARKFGPVWAISRSSFMAYVEAASREGEVWLVDSTESNLIFEDSR